MSLDTRDRRASALGDGLAAIVEWILPDGTINAADRIHLAGLYRGIAADEAEVVADFVPPPIAAVTFPGSPTATVEM
jgi:hypothetical protein